MLTILVPPHFLPHLKLSECQLFFSYSSWSMLCHLLTPMVRLLSYLYDIVQGTHCCKLTGQLPFHSLSSASADAVTSLFSHQCRAAFCCYVNDWLNLGYRQYFSKRASLVRIQPVVIQSPQPAKILSLDLHESHRSPILDSKRQIY